MHRFRIFTDTKIIIQTFISFFIFTLCLNPEYAQTVDGLYLHDIKIHSAWIVCELQQERKSSQVCTPRSLQIEKGNQSKLKRKKARKSDHKFGNSESLLFTLSE